MSDRDEVTKYTMLKNSILGIQVRDFITNIIGLEYSRVDIRKIAMKKIVSYPTMMDVYTFGDNAMPVTFYSCTLKLTIDGEKCKFKGEMCDTEEYAVMKALYALKRQYKAKEKKDE